jgi:hypothetical protein
MPAAHTSLLQFLENAAERFARCAGEAPPATSRSRFDTALFSIC